MIFYVFVIFTKFCVALQVVSKHIVFALLNVKEVSFNFQLY